MSRRRRPASLAGALFGAALIVMAGQELLLANRAPGPDAFGYSVAVTTNYTFLQITNGGTRALYLNDDQPVTNANIGFTFNFYGTSYTTVSFNVNGLMTFGGPSWAYANVDLTTSSPADNLPAIAVLWDDWETLDPWADAVYYKTLGSAPNRQFVVQWNRVVPVNGDGTNSVTFEARLLEGSDQILFSYFDAVVSDESTPVASLGVGATVGIRDVNGQTNNRNLDWSFNQPVITNGLNLLFSPPARPPRPTIQSILPQASGSMLLRFSGVAGAQYTVEASDDIRNWSAIGIASEGPPGQFQFTDTAAAALAGRYYRLRTP